MKIDVRMLADAQVAVAIPDSTRPVEWTETLDPLLAALTRVRAEVSVVVALGLHRPMTDEELSPVRTLVERHGASIRQHDASVPHFADDLTGAEAIVCVGVVEPHQYAGFSGGVKTVAIGCAPAEHISWMHRIELLRDARVALGRFDDNPFQDALWRTVADFPPIFGLYQVPTSSGSEVLFGPAREAMNQAVDLSRQHHFESIREPVGWLHLRVPSAKAQNLYQASRAATYAGLVEHPAIRAGGALIVEAAAPEGMGDGRGERACAQAMMRGRDALLEELDSNEPIPSKGGAQRAYVIARTMRQFSIAFVGTKCATIPALQAMGIPQLPTVADAVEHFGLSNDGLVVESPFHGIPTLTTT